MYRKLAKRKLVVGRVAAHRVPMPSALNTPNALQGMGIMLLRP